MQLIVGINDATPIASNAKPLLQRTKGLPAQKLSVRVENQQNWSAAGKFLALIRHSNMTTKIKVLAW